jgi:hypothetical protein
LPSCKPNCEERPNQTKPNHPPHLRGVRCASIEQPSNWSNWMSCMITSTVSRDVPKETYVPNIALQRRRRRHTIHTKIHTPTRPSCALLVFDVPRAPSPGHRPPRFALLLLICVRYVWGEGAPRNAAMVPRHTARDKETALGSERAPSSHCGRS